MRGTGLGTTVARAGAHAGGVGDRRWHDLVARHLSVVRKALARYHGREIEAGEPLHDMWVRLTLDDDLQVVDIEVATEAGPFQICPDIAPAFQVMKGERIQPGWHQRIKMLLGGVKGCIHLSEMLGAMGTVAYQTTYSRRQRAPGAKQRPPVDSCHALAADGELVKRYWPQFYRGD